MSDMNGFHYSSVPVASHTRLDYGTILINSMVLFMGVDRDPISRISLFRCLLVF